MDRDELGLKVMKYESSVPTILTPEQKEILTGYMLGDGSLESYKNKARLSLVRQSQDIEYLNWQFNKFKDFYGTGPARSTFFDKRYNKIYDRYLLKTRSSDVLGKFHKQWYPNGIKIVDRSINLTPLTALVWFLDDACAIPWGRNSLKIKFSTDGFVQDDTNFLAKLLQQTLNEKFSVFCKAKNKWVIVCETKASIAYIRYIEHLFTKDIGMERKRTWKDFDFKFFDENPNEYKSTSNIIRIIPDNAIFSPNTEMNNKLTRQQVIEIAKDPRPNAIIAKEYKVDRHAVMLIKKEQTWKVIGYK